MSNQNNDNKEEEKNKDILNVLQKNIKSDFIYFKEDILKEISQFEKNFSKQNQEIKDNLKNKIILYDSSIDNLKNQIQSLSLLEVSNNYLKEQVDKLSEFKKEISDLKNEQLKLNVFEKETHNNIFRINNMINNSIIYPGIIGISSKFKTFHEYIDFTLTELSTTKSFKNGIEIDLKTFKEKIDKTLSSLKIKIDTSFNSASQLVKIGLLENENKIKDFVQGKLFDVEVKNKELESKMEKAINELNSGINNMNNKTNEMFSKLDEEISKLKLEKNMIYKSIEESNNNYNEIKDSINNLEIMIKSSKKKEENFELMIKKSKIEIIDMVRNIIKKEKKTNLNAEKNIKTYYIGGPTLENQIQIENNILENKTDSNVKKISPDLKKIKKLSIKDEILEKKFDTKIIEKKDELLKLSKDKKIKNNNIIKNKSNNNLYDNIINKDEIKIIRLPETNIEEIDNKDIEYIDNEIYNKPNSTYNIKEYKNINQNYLKKNKRSYSCTKKRIEIKDPSRTLLKLKINLQDINAYLYSDFNIDSQKNIKNKFNTNVKDIGKKIPLTNRFSFDKDKIEIDALYKKNLIKYQSTTGFRNKNIKNALKIKNVNFKNLKDTNLSYKKENNYDLYRENSYVINNMEKPLSPLSIKQNNENIFDTPVNLKISQKNYKDLNLLENKEQS